MCVLGVMVETRRVQPHTAPHLPCPRGRVVELLCAFNALGALGVLCKTPVGYEGPGSERSPCLMLQRGLRGGAREGDPEAERASWTLSFYQHTRLSPFLLPRSVLNTAQILSDFILTTGYDMGSVIITLK